VFERLETVVDVCDDGLKLRVEDATELVLDWLEEPTVILLDEPEADKK